MWFRAASMEKELLHVLFSSKLLSRAVQTTTSILFSVAQFLMLVKASSLFLGRAFREPSAK